MLKHKIAGIVMGSLILSGVILGGTSIHNINRVNNTRVINKVLLAAPVNTVGERAVVINKDNSPLVLYSKAGASSGITSYISVGEMLTILSSGDNFYKVKVQETGAVGYISANNLQIITSGVNDPYNTVNKKGYIINVSSKVNLRENATMSSNILTKLTNNTKINVFGQQGQWYKVSYEGIVGYIYQEYIGLTNINLKITNINKPTNNSSHIATKVKTSDTSKVSSNINNNITQNKPEIKWVLNKNENTVANSLVIENTTGKPISDSQLVGYIKNWTLNYLINYYLTIAPTLWVPEFFNAVPDKDLIQAFINTNGKEALSKNITAGELFKTNTALIELVTKGPQLLSDKQIISYIHSVIPSGITKIVKGRYDYYIYGAYRKNADFHDYINIYTGFMNG